MSLALPVYCKPRPPRAHITSRLPICSCLRCGYVPSPRGESSLRETPPDWSHTEGVVGTWQEGWLLRPYIKRVHLQVSASERHPLALSRTPANTGNRSRRGCPLLHTPEGQAIAQGTGGVSLQHPGPSRGLRQCTPSPFSRKL